MSDANAVQPGRGATHRGCLHCARVIPSVATRIGSNNAPQPPACNASMPIRAARIPAFAAIIAALTILASPAGAQGRLRGLARLGVEYGGEKVVEFVYEDGSTPDVTAGGGLLLTVGGALGVWTRGAHSVDAQLSAGLKYRTIPPASNQEVTWLRFPVEGLLLYRMPNGIRLGAGATVHLRNRIDADGDAMSGSVAFRNTPGFVLQAEYVRRNLGFDLRYTAMEYELNGGFGTVGASSIGAGVTLFFGRSAPPG